MGRAVGRGQPTLAWNGDKVVFAFVSGGRGTRIATIQRAQVTCVIQGRGNYFEVWGGGQTSPGVQGSPYPKLKTPRIWPTIFFRETHVRVQKQTKIKLNHIDRPKFGGGGCPHSFKVVGASCPHCPPPPRFPRP